MGEGESESVGIQVVLVLWLDIKFQGKMKL